MNTKKAIKAMAKNKAVYWNDPDGIASGEYKIVQVKESNNSAIIENKSTDMIIEVDLNDLK